MSSASSSNNNTTPTPQPSGDTEPSRPTPPPPSVLRRTWSRFRASSEGIQIAILTVVGGGLFTLAAAFVPVIWGDDKDGGDDSSTSAPRTSEPPSSSTPSVVMKRFQNYGSSWCLGDNATDGVYVTGCNTSPYQKWIWNNGAVATPMRQVATWKCLTLGQDKLTLQSCDENKEVNWKQRWWVTFPAGGGTPLLKSAYNHRCITQDGRSVVMSVCAFDNEAQAWSIIEPR